MSQSTLDDLTSFTAWLVSVGRAASSPDEPLSAKLTAEERALLRRHADQLFSSVAFLKETIADHLDERIRGDVFHALWAAIGSTAVIAGHTIDDEIRARIQKDSAAHARFKKQKNDQGINKLIAQLAAPVRQRHPEFSEMAIATAIMSDLNERLPPGRAPFSNPDAIRKRMERNTVDD